MEVSIFGPTRVTTSDGVVVADDFGGVKPRQILEMLAISAGSPVSKESLAELLWDGHPPRSYLGTLESYVCVLRRTLRAAGARGGGVVTVRQGYLLDQQVMHVDLTSFRSLAREGRTSADPRACLARLEQALGVVGGALLADEAYAPWADAERELLRQELVDVESLAASCALALDRPDVAIVHAHAVLARDRLAEGAWRTLMRAMAATGRRAEALRAYSEVREHLADELGTDPSPETTDLYLDLLRTETPGSATVSTLDEVRMLTRLLREAVLAVPGLDAARGPRSWIELATHLTDEPAFSMAGDMAAS